MTLAIAQLCCSVSTSEPTTAITCMSPMKGIVSCPAGHPRQQWVKCCTYRCGMVSLVDACLVYCGLLELPCLHSSPAVLIPAMERHDWTVELGLPKRWNGRRCRVSMTAPRSDDVAAAAITIGKLQVAQVSSAGVQDLSPLLNALSRVPYGTLCVPGPWAEPPTFRAPSAAPPGAPC